MKPSVSVDARRSAAVETAERLADIAGDAILSAPAPSERRAGRRARRAAGDGYEFWQYRPYTHSDAARMIDWRRSARGENDLLVREAERETATGFALWWDRSASMDYRSGKAPEKGARAASFALGAAEVFARNEEPVRLIGGPPAAATGRGAAARLADAAFLDEESALPTGSDRDAAAILLVSDFLFDLDALERSVRAMAARGADGVLLHVYDPSETDFPYSGRVRFEDAEGGESVEFGAAESLAEAYREAVAVHAVRLQEIADEAGWRLLSHRTDEALEPAFERLVSALCEAGLS